MQLFSFVSEMVTWFCMCCIYCLPLRVSMFTCLEYQSIGYKNTATNIGAKNEV